MSASDSRPTTPPTEDLESNGNPTTGSQSITEQLYEITQSLRNARNEINSRRGEPLLPELPDMETLLSTEDPRPNVGPARRTRRLTEQLAELIQDFRDTRVQVQAMTRPAQERDRVEVQTALLPARERDGFNGFDETYASTSFTAFLPPDELDEPDEPNEPDQPDEVDSLDGLDLDGLNLDDLNLYDLDEPNQPNQPNQPHHPDEPNHPDEPDELDESDEVDSLDGLDPDDIDDLLNFANEPYEPARSSPSRAPINSHIPIINIVEEHHLVSVSDLPVEDRICCICRVEFLNSVYETTAEIHARIDPQGIDEDSRDLCVPTKLPCGHIAGDRCIRAWVDSCMSRASYAECPACRAIIRRAPPGTS